MNENPLKKYLTKTVIYALLTLFLIPIGTYLFTIYASKKYDSMILGSINMEIDRDRKLSSADRISIKADYQKSPPSSACTNTQLLGKMYRNEICETYSAMWQFNIARQVAGYTILFSVLILLTIGALSFRAYQSRTNQLSSLKLGWLTLTVSSVIQTILQGVALTWLSYWVTALLFKSYSPKLIGLVGIGVAALAFYVIKNIFQKSESENSVYGELLSEADAPGLWATIRKLAAHLKTEPPKQIVAGIDTNFFVTESPLTLNEKTLTGRSLFISIPLLRVLDKDEANAVLVHELAHLRDGDTASSALLGPKLNQYDHYCHRLLESGNAPVFHVMNLFRAIFEFSLMRDSREREFSADKTAAQAISGSAISQSLIKIAAYSSYRSKTEYSIFETNQKLAETIGISQRISNGWVPYAQSKEFSTDVQAANIPHPFDSHPALADRMSNVNHVVPVSDFGAIAARLPTATWADDILTAHAIEQRLWQVYEKNFSQSHENTLAYRYEPANDEERAVVLQYFPNTQFDLKKNKCIKITYEGIIAPDTTEVIGWDDLKQWQYLDGSFGSDTLVLTHPETRAMGLGNKLTKIKLAGIKPQRESLQSTIQMYWGRHEAAKQHKVNQQLVNHRSS